MLRPIGAVSIVPYRNVPRVSTVHCYACRMVRNSFDATAPASRFRAELALAFCTLLWGSTFVVVKNSLDHSSVFLFLALNRAKRFHVSILPGIQTLPICKLMNGAAMLVVRFPCAALISAGRPKKMLRRA